MFKSRTVFIVGAGASAELTLPIGDALKSKISTALKLDRRNFNPYTDDAITRAIKDYEVSMGNQRDAYTSDVLSNVAEFIAKNMPLAPSIDNFINSHRENPNIVALSKIAIARCILQAERVSTLYYAPDGAFALPMANGQFLSSWHIKLWQHLNADITVKSVTDIFQNVAFIVFNYDRCLEHFLFHCLRSYYNLTEHEASAILEKATIIHPYGQVGGLPFSNEAVIANFGDDNASILYNISRQIRTFMESINEGMAEDMRNILRNADTLVTLGFGFITQNLQLLTGSTTSITRAFLTAYGSSDTDAEMAYEKIGTMIDKRPNTKGWRFRAPEMFDPYVINGTCSELFNAHRLRLPDRAQG